MFWLHHAFVDKLWSDHQVVIANSRGSQYGGTHRGRRVSVNDQLPGTPYRVRDLLDTRDICFHYANPGAPNPPPPRTSSVAPPPRSSSAPPPISSSVVPRSSAIVSSISRSTTVMPSSSVSSSVRPVTTSTTGSNPEPTYLEPDYGESIGSKYGYASDDSKKLAQPKPLPDEWLEKNFEEKEKAKEVQNKIIKTAEEVRTKVENGESIPPPYQPNDQENRVYTGGEDSPVNSAPGLLGVSLVYGLALNMILFYCMGTA